ncbi:hypothetical protein [Alicyclobacillus sp.]|uniref:hypothetical protein n=1 Tax=Alicyclobacillus sp. TaxID=61169 RepID=UPI0025BC34A5|nr:hypothetical protein [Alicyclobacillus sp.]MCL6517887.1 hypothetical protein [Alicyclobacillus sp.]
MLLSRPLSESAFYLENRQLQYIHAMFLARPGGEHDHTHAQMDAVTDPDAANDLVAPYRDLAWPPGFEACPGAVYYYAIKRHCITKVDPVNRTITAGVTNSSPGCQCFDSSHLPHKFSHLLSQRVRVKCSY